MEQRARGAELADTLKRQGSYRLGLDERGSLVWTGSNEDGSTTPRTQEPDASLWKRMMLNLLAPLVPESLL